MTNEIFKPVKASQRQNNAIVGGAFHSNYTYAIGYQIAGDILIDKAVEDKSQDLLFFPICFNYRHFIELSLKELICSIECLNRVNITCIRSKPISSIKTIQEVVNSLNDMRHSIQKLAEWLKKSLSETLDEQFDSKIWDYLIEWHNNDPNCQTFRYAMNKKLEPFFPKQKHYDLKNIKSKMKEIDKYFSGLDAHISYQIEIAEDMVSEYNEKIEF